MHCLFAGGPTLISIPTPAGGVRNRYRVNAVEVVQGQRPALPEPGWELHRIEAENPISASAPFQIHGATGSAQYTDPTAPYAAANGLKAIPVTVAEPVLAVILPLRKTQAWWDLPFEQRKAHFHKAATVPHHTEAGVPYISKIHRRLFHTREFTKEYDFVTYFEFRAADEAAFRKLCRELRDTKINPEWNYIDRDFEIWMTKLA
jgi:hypothetical protein